MSSVFNSDVEPNTVSQALSDARWRDAMSAEFTALLNNGTWDLVPPDPSHNVVGCKWVFRIKRKPNGYGWLPRAFISFLALTTSKLTTPLSNQLPSG